MLYDAHFIIDVENRGQETRVNGTVQIMDNEDLFLSDSAPPLHFPVFPDEDYPVDETLAHMVNVAKIYDRVLVLAEKHGLYVCQSESGLRFSSGGIAIGSVMIGRNYDGFFLQTTPIFTAGVSKRIIWDHFVVDINGDPDIVGAHVPFAPLPSRWAVEEIHSSSRFHVYTRPLGEEIFVSGEAALTEDTLPFASWDVNIGLIRTDNVAEGVQEVFERLVLGAIVTDRLVSVADECGIHLISVANDLIGVYLGEGIIGQVTVDVRGGIVELSPRRLATPTWTDREEGAWNDFCSKVREVPDSKTV